MRSTIRFRKGRTEPPCKAGGIDCIRREVGCRSECEAWKAWEKVHAQEIEEINRKKANERALLDVTAGRGERKRKAAQRDYEERERRTK